LYLIFEKQRESKSIDKQIDRLIREAIAEANRGRFRKSQSSFINFKIKDTPKVAKKPKRQYHPLELS
jgi:hypothetical protein